MNRRSFFRTMFSTVVAARVAPALRASDGVFRLDASHLDSGAVLGPTISYGDVITADKWNRLIRDNEIELLAMAESTGLEPATLSGDRLAGGFLVQSDTLRWCARLD